MTAPIDVRLDAIELDVSIQCRASIDTAVVNEYAEAMTGGATFPPIMLLGDGGKHYIGDGWHRVMASQQIKALSIAATVEPGGRDAALRHALGANALHGHRRTNADKRRAVEIAIHEFPKVSTAVLASMCGVSRPFVDSMKPQDATVASSTVTGADGKQYPAKRPKSAEYITVASTVTAHEPATISVAVGPEGVTQVKFAEPGEPVASRMHPINTLERLKTLAKRELGCLHLEKRCVVVRKLIAHLENKYLPKTIPPDLEEILKELEYQGAQHMAAYSPSTVLQCAHRLRARLRLEPAPAQTAPVTLGGDHAVH